MNADARSNPLLDFSDLPRFDAIRAEHVGPAVDELLARARATVEAVVRVTQPPTWENVVAPLADALDELDRAWGAVHHLNAVASTPAMREAYHAGLPKVTAFSADLAQDERLYARYKALAESPAFATLDPARRALVLNELRDFRLGGAELPPPQKARLKAVEEELADLSARFDDNVLDATNAFALFVDDVARLAGVPADVIATARAAAHEDGRSGWKLTLRMPCFRPVMTYAADRALRAELHRAYATRASELGANPDWDNTPLIRRILELRREAASSSATRTTRRSRSFQGWRSTREVMDFLGDLARHAKPFAEREYAELAAFAQESLAIGRLEAWDLWFASEKLKEQRHAFSDQEVRAYFPEDRVLTGLFRLTETLYGVAIRETRAPTWHPTVRFFELADRAGALVGQFYLDLYARPGKQGGAWMDDAIRRRSVGAGRAASGRVSHVQLLGPDRRGRGANAGHVHARRGDHAVPRVRTRAAPAPDRGRRGRGVGHRRRRMGRGRAAEPVHGELLLGMGRRRADDRPRRAPARRLPRALFDKMRTAKNFQSGMDMVRQLEYGLFDMVVHSTYDPRAGAPRRRSLDAVRREVAVAPRPAYDRFMQSFCTSSPGATPRASTATSGRKCSRPTPSACSRSAGVLSPTAGARFRAEVLAQGAAGRPWSLSWPFGAGLPKSTRFCGIMA